MTVKKIAIPFLPEASFGLWVLSSPASVCVSVCVCVNHLLVRAITRDPFKLGTPNLDQRCKRPWLRTLLFWGGNWPWPSRSNLTSKSEFTPFWACPDHYSPPIPVRISKFGQQMHFSTVKIPVNAGLDGPWTSPSFLIPKLFFIVAVCIETVKQSLVCFNAVGTVSQSRHQCTWGTHSQSGMGLLVL